MKLLSVALDYRPALLSSAGIGRAVRELVRALAARRGLRLHLFGHSLAAARHPGHPPPGAQLHRLPIPGRSLPSLARLGLSADRLAGSPSVFHWTDYIYPPVQHAAAVLTIHDLAFALQPEFHGADQASELLRRTATAATAARAILVPSQATAAVVREQLAPSAPVEVIPFGADHVARWAARAGDHPLGGRPYLLALGTVEPRKNHLRLIAAWRQLGDRAPALVVIGRRGWECDATVAALEDGRRDGALQWLEDADDLTVFRHLVHASALLYPSLHEGFGFPPLESMALGVPVVAGDTPALHELTDGCALLCDPRDEGTIASAIDRIVADSALRQRLIRDGPRRAATFTWAAAANAHHRVYAEASR